MSAIPDGVLVLDDAGRIVDCNEAAQRVSGLPNTMVGRSIADLRQGPLGRVAEMVAETTNDKDIEVPGDPPAFYHMRSTEINDSHGDSVGWVVMIHDVTERTRLYRQVQELATHDDLTGLLNRRAFMDRLVVELERCYRQPAYHIALLLIDLDHLKEINDSIGHIAGDEALVAFSQTVQRELRSIDLFARIGGDEFAVLLTNADMDQALIAAERLQEAIRASRPCYNGQELSLSASIGLLATDTLGPEALDLEKLVLLADQALYQAKDQGRDRIVMANPPDRAP